MTPLRCPHCVAELHTQPEPKLSGCPECGGVFCDKATLKGLIDQARQSLSTELYQRPKVPLAAPLKYARCPACDQLMDRHNFGGSSGVVVDVCVKDGVWFDNGELAQVVHFCASESPAPEKLDKLLRQGQSRAEVILLNFPDTSEKPIDQMSPREMALDVLSFLRLLIP